MRTLSAFALAAALASHAAASDLIPRRQLFSDNDRSQVQISADGKLIGWIQRTDGGPQLRIADIDTMGRERSVDAPAPVGMWRWTYGGPALAVAGASLLRVDPGSGKSADIAHADWAPAEARIGIVALHPAKPNDAIVSVASATETVAGLWRVNIADGTAKREHSLENYSRWVVDGNLEVRGAFQQAPDALGLFRRTAAGEWKHVASYDWAESWTAGLISCSTDGKTLYAVDPHGRDKAVLAAIDVETGSQTVLAEDPLADILGAGATVDPETGVPQAVASYYVRLRRQFLDRSLEADFAFLGAYRSGDVSFAGRSADGSRWLVRTMDGGPFEYSLYDRTSRKVTPLFSELSALDSGKLASRRPMIVPSRDGKFLLPCDVYLPNGSDADGDGIPDKPLPAVFYVHGGPWIGFEWNSWFTNRNFQLLANRGYAVVRTDFRSAAGYGKKFMDAGDRELGGAVMDDIEDIALFAAERGIAQRDRMALWGWSFGGYAAMTCLAKKPDLFACAISMYGLCDLERFVIGMPEQSGEILWYPRGGDVRTDAGAELLRNHSAINFVDQIAKPIFMTHGLRDERVPIEQSDLFAEALTEKKKPFLYTVYPQEAHDYMRPESWESFWAMGEAFLAKHLGGAAEPFGEELKSAKFEVRAGGELIGL